MDAVKVLQEYCKRFDTGDLANLFLAYMRQIGANKLDRRRKDTSNTYEVDGESTGWNRVECYYYKNTMDYVQYGKFDFSIALRKRMGDYLVLETGSPTGEIRRVFEVSYGEVIGGQTDLLANLVNQHRGLFDLMEQQVS